MVEIPEHLLWDGDTTDIEMWDFPTSNNHYWFSPSTSAKHLYHYYGLLEDGRVVKITNETISESRRYLAEDAVYLGFGGAHHRWKK